MDRFTVLQNEERRRRPEPTRSMAWVEQRGLPTAPAPAPGMPPPPPELDGLRQANNYFATQWTIEDLADRLLRTPGNVTLAGLVLQTATDGQHFVDAANYDLVPSYIVDPQARQAAKDSIDKAKSAPWYELRETACGVDRARGLRALVKTHLDTVKELSTLAGGRDAFARTHTAADREDVVLQLAYMLHARDVVRVAKIVAADDAATARTEQLRLAKEQAEAQLQAAKAAMLQNEKQRLLDAAEQRKQARATVAYRTAYAAELVRLEPWRAELLDTVGTGSGNTTSTTPSATPAHETQARNEGEKARDAVMAEPVGLFGYPAPGALEQARLDQMWLAGALANAALREQEARVRAAIAAHDEAVVRAGNARAHSSRPQVGLLGRSLDPLKATRAHVAAVARNAAAASSANGLGLGLGAVGASDAPGDVEGLEAYGTYRQWRQSQLYHQQLTDATEPAAPAVQRRGYERQLAIAQQAQGMPIDPPLPPEWGVVEYGATPGVPLPMEPPLLPARISAPPRMGKSALILEMATFAAMLPDGFVTIGIAPNKTLPMQEWFAKIDALGWDHPLVDAAANDAGLVPRLDPRFSAADPQGQAYAAALETYRAQHTGGLVTGYMSNGALYRRTAHLPHHDKDAHRQLHRWRCVDETAAEFRKRSAAALEQWKNASPLNNSQADFEASPAGRALVRETRDRWLPALRAAFEGPHAVRVLLYSVNVEVDVRGLNGVLEALQERPESFVLKVYDESQFLSRQDYPELQTQTPTEVYRLQAELRRTAPIMLGLPLMVSATQLAARFERVFYGPVRADTDMRRAEVPEILTTPHAQTQYRYQMLPLADVYDLAEAKAIAPILPPSLRPRAFVRDEPHAGAADANAQLPTTYYGSTAYAPCGHVRAWTPKILTPWWPAGPTLPEPANPDPTSLAHQLYAGPANPSLRASLSLRPGMLSESGQSFRDACKTYPVLTPLYHGPKVVNLEASMRLVVRHFLEFLRSDPVALEYNDGGSGGGATPLSYALPMYVLATCRDVYGPLGMLHQVRLLTLYALWLRAQSTKWAAHGTHRSRANGVRQHYLRRKWGLAFVVVADCTANAAAAVSMSGGRPGTAITTCANFADKTKPNPTTQFYLKEAAVPAGDAAHDPAVARFVAACAPEAGNLARTKEDVEVVLYLLDPVLPRNRPRDADLVDALKETGKARNAWHGLYPLFGADPQPNEKPAQHPHFVRHAAAKQRLVGPRAKETTAWKAYTNALRALPQLLGQGPDALPTTNAAAVLATGTTGLPTPEGLANALEATHFEVLTSQSNATRLSAAGVALLLDYYSTTPAVLQQLFAASAGGAQNLKIGTSVRKKQATYFTARAARQAAEAAFATDPAKDPPEKDASHSVVYDGAGHQTDDFPDLSHLFDAWPNPLDVPNDEPQAEHLSDDPWTANQVTAMNDRIDPDVDSLHWERDGARRGDLRAYGCTSVAGAVRLAAALDIHRVCAVGYAKMASALTLQSTLANQPFELHPSNQPPAQRSASTTLCYVPRYMALASSEESGLDEMYQILGRTFVDMKTRKLPNEWKVELLSARLDDRATRGWPGTLVDCLRATAPNPGDALPTLLDSLRYLAKMEHLFAEQPVLNLAEMNSSANARARMMPGDRNRTQNQLSARAEELYGRGLPAGAWTATRPTAQHCAAILRAYELAAKEIGPTATPNPTATEALERGRAAGLLMRRVGHRQSMGRTSKHGPSALWRLFYADHRDFRDRMGVPEPTGSSAGSSAAP